MGGAGGVLRDRGAHSPGALRDRAPGLSGGSLAAARGRAGRRRRELGGAAPALAPAQLRPPRASWAARSFSDSCSGIAARPAVLAVCPRRSQSTQRHGHPADHPSGPGTVGLPPRGRQRLRAASRHFPGRSGWDARGSGEGPGRGAARAPSEPGGARERPGAPRAERTWPPPLPIRCSASRPRHSRGQFPLFAPEARRGG